MDDIKEIKDKFTCMDILGEPLKQTPKGFLYRVPWRTDNNPSLSVTPNGRGWKDLSFGDHGSIIDLAMRVWNTSSVGEAIKRIKEKSPITFSFNPSDSPTHESKDSFSFFEVVPLRTRALYAYLHQRKVNIDLAKQFLQEAHYSFQERQDGKYLYALAYANDKGGYELRSSFYKGCNSPKGITTHLGRENAPTVVFEGFFDMLSFATLCGEVKHNYIVLNSTVNTPAAIEALRSMSGKILLCLDNDKGGEEATKEILDALPLAIDYRSHFAGHKDVNEFLCSTRKG